MAQNLPNPANRRQQIIEIRDRYNEVILRMTSTDTMIRNPDGSVLHISNQTLIETSDGSQWSPEMLQKNPAIHICICDPCRHKSLWHKATFGITLAAYGKICSRCGIRCCPRHRTLCSDNQWRCLSCARKFRIKSWLRWIFFSRKEN